MLFEKESGRGAEGATSKQRAEVGGRKLFYPPEGEAT